MNEGINRLPHGTGSSIDRSKSVSFSFDGKSYQGYAGDTIASALAANDQWILSRSFKYRRPRGVLTMAGQDANTLIQLPDEPNVLADTHAISDGLKADGQNYDGSLGSRQRGDRRLKAQPQLHRERVIFRCGALTLLIPQRS